MLSEKRPDSNRQVSSTEKYSGYRVWILVPPYSSGNPFSYRSSTQRSNSEFEPFPLWLEKLHRIHECSLIPDNHKKGLSRAQNLYMREPKGEEVSYNSMQRSNTPTEQEFVIIQRNNLRSQHQKIQYHHNDWFHKKASWRRKTGFILLNQSRLHCWIKNFWKPTHDRSKCWLDRNADDNHPTAKTSVVKTNVDGAVDQSVL